LFVKPAEEFLKPFIRADFIHGVEVVAQLVMRPSLVDEILATVARGRNLASTLAARHDMMSARRDFSLAKDTDLFHVTDSGLSK
jgi:hypothetical protein